MKHQLTSKTKLLQKAWLLSDGKLLILKRSLQSRTRAGQWDLPGGNSEWPDADMDINQPHQADLIREVSEETGLDVAPFWKNRQQPIYFTTYFQGREQLFTTIVVWFIKLPRSLSAKVKISHEHSDFIWVRFDVLDQYDFGFAGGPAGFIGASMKRLLPIIKDLD